jgi:phosphoadenosine phosphosulfate reductase
MLTSIYWPDLSSRWNDILVDFATKTNKTDINDYISAGRWKARRGASGLESKNVNITDIPCNLAEKARNIVAQKPIGEDFIELLKPFGKIGRFEKEEVSYITITDINDGSKVCDIIINFGGTIIKVLPGKGVDISLLVNRLKCQIRKYQFCIKCTACDSVCTKGAITTINKKYVIDDSKCTRCKKCIAKFYNGCIMCEVLAGKKNNQTEEIDL